MSKSTGCNGNDHDYKPTAKLMFEGIEHEIELYKRPKVDQRRFEKVCVYVTEKKQKGPHPR